MTIRKHVGRRLTDDQEAVLAGGPGVLSFTTLEETFGTMDQARAAWATHGERLTAEYGCPGVPMWGWEQFEATPEELEQAGALQERQRRGVRTQPETVDPLADALPMTRLYFPQLDGDSNGHDPNGNHDIPRRP
jgi:hypothetical protein